MVDEEEEGRCEGGKDPLQHISIQDDARIVGLAQVSFVQGEDLKYGMLLERRYLSTSFEGAQGALRALEKTA
jgi:hypothetical protein